MRGTAFGIAGALGLIASLLSGCDCEGEIGPGNQIDRDGSSVGPVDATIIANLDSIRVEPAEATIVIENGVAATQEFHAIGTFVDGSERDISEIVTWRTVGLPFVGTFSRNVFTSTTSNGGRTHVHAVANGSTGAAELDVVLRGTFEVEPLTAAALPANSQTLFASTAVDATRAPSLVYPNDGTALPPNLGRLEIHWLQGSASNTLFEISFTNEVTDARAYSRCERPEGIRADGCIWELGGAFWTWIAETNRAGLPLTIQVRATDDSGTAIGASNTLTIQFARDALDGTIYYWTTSGGQIMRFDFGAAAGTAEVVMGPTQTTSGRCVGCHAISHDGRKVIGSVGGIGIGGALMYDLETYTPLWNQSSDSDHILQFASFSPDSNQIAAVYGDDERGVDGLMLFDVTCDGVGACGTQIGSISNAGREVSHPAWSPSGNVIAYTDVHDVDSGSQRPRRGGIGAVHREGEAWSAPTELVPYVPGLNRYNPDWSPDETILAYNESTCPDGDEYAMDCNADSDPSATIWAVSASGGAPIRLDHTAAPGALDQGRTELNNTFPRFAPNISVLFTGDLGDENLVWMSFGSTRSYGLREPPASGNSESGNRSMYLWMSAILPGHVVRGVDPSYAPFALPFQDLATSNHIAVWTTESVGNVGPD